MLRAVEVEELRRQHSNPNPRHARSVFRVRLCCLLLVLQMIVLISIFLDPTALSYAEISPKAALLYVFQTTKVFMPARVSIGLSSRSSFNASAGVRREFSTSLPYEYKYLEVQTSSKGSALKNDSVLHLPVENDTISRHSTAENSDSTDKAVPINATGKAKAVNAPTVSVSPTMSPSAVAAEASMASLVNTLKAGLFRDPNKSNIGICTRVLSLEELLEVNSTLLPSIASTPTRKELRNIAFTLYIGVPVANVSAAKKAVSGFVSPKFLQILVVEAQTPLAVVQLAVDLEEDFFVYVAPHGTFYVNKWASTSIRRMERRMPRGIAFLNITATDRGIEGLFFSSKMFEAILRGMFHSVAMRTIQPRAIADELRVLYGDDAIPSKGTYYINRGRPNSRSPHWQMISSLSNSVDQAFLYAKQTLSSFDALKGVAEKGMGAYKSWSDKQFRSFQLKTLAQLTDTIPEAEIRASTNILLVLTVSSTDHTAWQVEKFMRFFAEVQRRQQLKYNSSDTVKFLLNFYRPKTALWDRILKKWSTMVHGQRLGLPCKIHLWTHLNKNVIHGFDYVWLLDDDLDLTFFNWELARLLLKKLDPLVAAPGILPMRKNGRTSYWEVTHAKPHFDPSTFSLSVARNVDFVEVMTPIIATKFWPIIFDRLKYFDLSGVYCIDCFWSQTATEWGGKHCGRRAPLVVMDLSPIVHTDLRTLGKLLIYQMKEGKRSKYAGCIRGPIQANLNVSKFSSESFQPSFATTKYHRQTYYLLRDAVKEKQISCPLQPSLYQPEKLWTALNI